MFIYPWGDFHSLNLGWFLLQFKDWVEKIQEYLDNGGGTSENLANVIAPVFNAANSYQTGDYVLYNNVLYKANQDVNPGTWDPNIWDSCLIVDEMGSGGGAGVDNVARLMIAGQYSQTFPYQKYAICRYNDKLWMANTDLPAGGEAWNAAHWDEITVGAGLSGLRRSVDTLFNMIENSSIARIAQGKVSIIGDSISTFDQTGYKIEGYNMYYPNENYPEEVNDINKTWWKKVLDACGCAIEVNASYSGSGSTKIGNRPSFYDRVSLIGSPNTIIVALGTNDSASSATMGSYDYTTEYTQLSETEFRPSYIKGMKALQYLYPDAKIIALILKMSNSAYSDSIISICTNLGIEVYKCDNYEGLIPNNVHANTYGMSQIASQFLTNYPINLADVLAVLKLNGGGNVTGNIGVISPNIDLTTTPTTNKLGNGFVFYDRNNTRLVLFRPYQYTNGDSGFQIIVTRTINGVAKYNQILLGISDNGDIVVTLDDAAKNAWRAALGIT